MIIQATRRCQGMVRVGDSFERCKNHATTCIPAGDIIQHRCEEHGYPWNKRGVCVVMLFNNQLLGVVRYNKPGDVNLPGGKVNEGESDYEAVIRECEEETGLKILNPIPVYCDTDGERVCTTFVAQFGMIGISPGGSDEGRAGWFTVEDMLKPTCTFLRYNTALFKRLGLYVGDEDAQS